jgi:hypothetical protein
MKYSKLILVLFAVVLVSSCQTNTQKITGSYIGLFNNTGSEETIVITAGSSDNKVNMSASGGWFNSQTIMDVTLTSAGQTVNISYSSSDTTMFEIIGISGSLEGQTLSFIETYNYPGGPESVNFTGTKQ